MSDLELYHALKAIALARWPESDIHNGPEPISHAQIIGACQNILDWLDQDLR